MLSKLYLNLCAILIIIAADHYISAASDSKPVEKMTIGPQFHQQTSFGKDGFKAKEVGWGRSVPLYKEYKETTKLRLPPPDFEGKCLEKVIRERRSRRHFGRQPMNLKELAQVLLSANGITSNNETSHRAAPSAGALYPIEIYVAAHNIESIEDGLYHFQVADSTLELVKPGEFGDSLHLYANQQSVVGSSPCTIVLTARFDRSTVKYADRGYRYAYMEAGAICQNIYLQATSLDMGTCAVGAFNDDALNALLEIDGTSEAALLLMPLGHL